MPCNRGPIRTCVLPPSHLDCNVKGAAPFSLFSSPNKSRATLQMLKGLLWHPKWGLGWFRHTQGRLLHFESDALRVGPPLQLAMVLRGLSFRLEAGKLQIGTLRADDSHTFKPRCVPGDFLS